MLITTGGFLVERFPNGLGNPVHRDSGERDASRHRSRWQALLPFGDKIVPALSEALGDTDANIRIFALKILEHFDSNTKLAIPAMIKALEDPDRIVRIAALTPVASFGEKAIDAVPILEKWIDDDVELARVSAAGHILMIDPSKAEELLPVLLKALESDDIGIRCQTAWLLGQLGELAKEAVPELKRLLNDEDLFVRNQVGEVLLKIMDAVTTR